MPRWIGGGWVKPARENAFRSVVGLLKDDERAQFAELIESTKKPASGVPASTRSFVKEWKLEDFTPSLEARLKEKRDLQNGRNLFTATGCIACHNFRGDSGLAGPDLSAAGGRYSARDLLDNILNPSKVINEQYALTTFTKKDGSQLVGRLVNLSGDDLIVVTNPMDPGGSETHFSPHLLASTEKSPVSLMPPGLLNTRTETDLLAHFTQPSPEDASTAR